MEKFVRRRRRLGVVLAVIAVADLGALRVVGGAAAPPGFQRGGAFLGAGSPGRPYPYTSPGPIETVTDEAPPEAAGGAVVPAGAMPVTGSRPAAVSAVAVPGRDGRVLATGGSTPTPTEASAPVPTPDGAKLRMPAAGTYVYALDGQEEATGFGARSFPDRLTATVHGADGLAPDEAVLDLRFSEDHEERLILRVAEGALLATFEGGSITFGPGTQTSQADYSPPMLLVPAAAGDAPEGTVVRGTSDAKEGDRTTRVEDWTVTTLGRETISALGRSFDTWVIRSERKTKPGSSDQVHRVRTGWYDPQSGLWVRWTERFDGHRSTLGVQFAYSSSYTATLQAVEPA